MQASSILIQNSKQEHVSFESLPSELIQKIIGMSCNLNCLLVNRYLRQETINLLNHTLTRIEKEFDPEHLSIIKRKAERDGKPTFTALEKICCLSNYQLLRQTQLELPQLPHKNLQMTYSSFMTIENRIREACFYKFCGFIEPWNDKVCYLNLSGLDSSSVKKRTIEWLNEGQGAMPELKALLLDHGPIPEEIKYLTSLEALQISTLELFTCLPTGLFELIELRALKVNACIHYLSPAIAQLNQLELLDLSCNDLESLPEEIGNVRSLTHLLLDNNLLSSLPSSITKLTNLKSLNISFNKIEVLPIELLHFRGLEIIL